MLTVMGKELVVKCWRSLGLWKLRETIGGGSVAFLPSGCFSGSGFRTQDSWAGRAATYFGGGAELANYGCLRVIDIVPGTSLRTVLRRYAIDHIQGGGRRGFGCARDTSGR